jgi:hypothetical protein
MCILRLPDIHVSSPFSPHPSGIPLFGSHLDTVVPQARVISVIIGSADTEAILTCSRSKRQIVQHDVWTARGCEDRQPTASPFQNRESRTLLGAMARQASGILIFIALADLVAVLTCSRQ